MAGSHKITFETIHRVKALDNKNPRMISVIDKNFTEVGINIFDGSKPNRGSKSFEFEVGMDDIKVFINQRILQTLSRLLQQKKSRSFYYLENRTCCDVTISQSKVRRVQKILAYTTGDLFIPYPNDNFQLNLKSDGLKPDQINRNLNLYKIGSPEKNKKFDSGVEVYQDGNKFVVEGSQALLNETKFTITIEVGSSYWPDSEQTSDWLSNKHHYENYFKVNNLQKLGSVKINPGETKTLPFLVKSLKLIADDPNGPKKSCWSTEILLEARTQTAVDIGDGNFIGLSILRRSESTQLFSRRFSSFDRSFQQNYVSNLIRYRKSSYLAMVPDYLFIIWLLN